MMTKPTRNQNIQYTCHKIKVQTLDHKPQFLIKSFNVIKMKKYCIDTESLVPQVVMPMTNTNQGKYYILEPQMEKSHSSSLSIVFHHVKNIKITTTATVISSTSYISNPIFAFVGMGNDSLRGSPYHQETHFFIPSCPTCQGRSRTCVQYMFGMFHVLGHTLNTCPSMSHV